MDGIDYQIDIFVGSRGFFGDVLDSMGFDDDSLAFQLVHELSSVDFPERFMAGHPPSGTVTGRIEALLGSLFSGENIGGGSHGSGNNDRLPGFLIAFRELLVSWRKGAACSFSVHQQVGKLSIHQMGFAFGDIVSHVVEETELSCSNNPFP